MYIIPFRFLPGRDFCFLPETSKAAHDSLTAQYRNSPIVKVYQVRHRV